jgi:ABC-2 type transport system ATP-binding protein
VSAAVVVEDLVRRFGEFVAVDHVSFEVARGEVFGFLGPNGAGKTTTIRMLIGLLLPSSGSGRVAGFDIMSESEAIKRNIGYMSQLFSLYGDLTVEENIALFSGLYNVERSRRSERRDWVIEMAGLTEHRKRLVRELSLGWKQRLALGCAVLHEPSIIFLDEPTSGVDPISRRTFWDLIYDLASEGRTIFVTTHYMEEAEYANRLALMNRGRLIALDTPNALRESMREPLFEIDVEDSIRAVPLLQQSAMISSAALFGRLLHVAVKGESAGRAEVERLLRTSGIDPGEIRRIRPSLEDVFVSLVRSSGGAVDG